VSLRPDVFHAILLLGLVSLACRLSGFFLMRYVSITPRVDAWLRAIPISLVGAVLGPVATNGGPPEWAGLIIAVGLMYVMANEFVAAMCAPVRRSPECESPSVERYSSSSTTRFGSTLSHASLPSGSGSMVPRIVMR
jgi:uncharacterized membrane protein